MSLAVGLAPRTSVAVEAKPPRSGPLTFPTSAPLPSRPTPRATDAWPWLGLSFAGFYLSKLGVPYSLGPELGTYVAHRVRIAGRLLVPLSQDDVCDGLDLISVDETGVWDCLPSGKAKLGFGGSLGVVLLESRSVVFAPGLTVLGTNLAEPGTLIGLSLPVDWVAPLGVRVSLEFGFGFALGREERYVCAGTYGTCMAGDVKQEQNLTPTAGLVALTVGWGPGYTAP